MSIKTWKTLFLVLASLSSVISVLAIVDGLTSKPTDGLIWRLGLDHVIVERVIEGGPGDIAGLKKGDVILGINRNLVNNPRQAAAILMQQLAGIRIPYLVQRNDEILTFNLTPHPYRTGDNRLLYNAIVGFFFLGVGLYTFLCRPNLPTARLFFLLNLCFLMVLTCSFRGSPYYWIDLIVQNVARWGLAFLGPLFLHFFLIFPNRKRFLSNFAWVLPVLYIIPSIQHILFTLTQFYAFPVSPLLVGSGGRELFGVQIDLWALTGLYLVAGVAALLDSSRRSTDPLRRRQINMVLWGIFIGLTPFLALSVIGAGIFGKRDLFSIGVLPLAAIPLSFAYSLIRYRLMEIRVFVKSGILYSLLTGLFIGIYMVIVNVLGGWVERVSPFGGSVFGVLFVLVVAIGFEPTRFRLQKVINRLFSRTDFDRHATLSKLSDALRSLTDMDELAYAALDAIDHLFNPNSLVLSIISDRADGMDVNRYSIGSNQMKKRVHHLDEETKSKPHEILFSDREDTFLSPEAIYVGGMQRSPKETPPERLELPMFSHEKVVGLLSMGKKNTDEPYTMAELESLERFAGQAGLAIENLQLIRSIFNANQRLFDAEKLASLGQLASGVAHEIRNPLSSIKMNIQGMARNLRLDAINQRRLQIIQREIDHLDHVVHDVLIYARPSRLEIEAVQPREVIMQTLEVMAPGLQKMNHRVIMTLPQDLPEVKADKDKLHQVIKNLVANAAEAMGTDGVLTISSRISSTHVDLLFKDNGQGILSDILNSIWNPFFTTKADGTGLGLANVRKFVQEMGGEVEVESSEDEGTVFILTLRKTSNQKAE